MNQNLSTLQYNFLKIIDYRVICTIFCIIISTLPFDLLIHFLAVLGVLSIGILHGANDLTLVKKLGFLKSKWQRFLSYVFFVLLFSVLLYRIPSVALMIFVGISAYHFGEQQWHKYVKNQTVLVSVFYFVFGLFLFAALFFAHASKVSDIIYQISDWRIEESFFQTFALSCLFALVLLILVLNKNIKLLLIDLLVQTTLLMILFWTTDLLVGFAVYFVFWHSWPSLKDQSEILYQTQHSFKKYLIDAWLYWLLSIAGLAFLYFYNDTLGLDPLALFFAFLAAITFPHVLVIFGLNRLFKPNANA